MSEHKTVVTTLCLHGERPAIYGPDGQGFMYFKQHNGKNYLQPVPAMSFDRIIETVSSFMRRRKGMV